MSPGLLVILALLAVGIAYTVYRGCRRHRGAVVLDRACTQYEEPEP